MNFAEATRSCLTQYASFRGRAARSEFWFFVLFVLICATVASVLDNLLGTNFHRISPFTGQLVTSPYGFVYSIVLLALLLPNISVQVRRLHDTGRSGWWCWLALIPIIGGIILLIWFCSRGSPGENDYGHDPLAAGIAQTFN